ncbi:hypothetical protein [Kibdelosporangium philippinense]|uniref:hypothetical protein n=1 Tax=Kibdelosporangium philippinense TaxID=211113 RepID=UPI0036143CF4
MPAPYRLTHGKRNPIAAWLDEFGLFGLRSHEKFVPQQIFSAPNSQVALFSCIICGPPTGPFVG